MGARKQGVSSQDQNSSCLAANQHQRCFRNARSRCVCKTPVSTHASKILIWRAVNSRIPQSVNETAPLHHFKIFCGYSEGGCFLSLEICYVLLGGFVYITVSLLYGSFLYNTFCNHKNKQTKQTKPKQHMGFALDSESSNPSLCARFRGKVWD